MLAFRNEDQGFFFCPESSITKGRPRTREFFPTLKLSGWQTWLFSHKRAKPRGTSMHISNVVLPVISWKYEFLSSNTWGLSEVQQGTCASHYQDQQQSNCGHRAIPFHHILACPCPTFAIKSFLEAVQDVREPPHVVNQLHHRLRVHSGGPHQVRRQRHGAQRVWVLQAPAHIPGFGGSCRQRSSVWLGMVFVRSLAALRPTTAAVALPDHSSAARVLGWGTQVRGRRREQCCFSRCDVFFH